MSDERSHSLIKMPLVFRKNFISLHNRPPFDLAVSVVYDDDGKLGETARNTTTDVSTVRVDEDSSRTAAPIACRVRSAIIHLSFVETVTQPRRREPCRPSSRNPFSTIVSGLRLFHSSRRAHRRISFKTRRRRDEEEEEEEKKPVATAANRIIGGCAERRSRD